MKNNIQNNQFNVYTGMFDFSDDGKRSTLLDSSTKMKILIEKLF
jgi:hypothetical protein